MRFKLHQDTAIGDRYYETGTEVEIEPLARAGDTITRTLPSGQTVFEIRDTDLLHVPGPHWEPADQEAKRYCKQLEKEGRWRFSGQMPDVLGGLEMALAEASATRIRPQDAAMIGASVAEALRQMGVVAPPATPPTT